MEMDEIARLQAELEAERAKLAEIEARREARVRGERLRQELDDTKRASHEAELLEELEAKHGPVGRRIMRIDTDEGMLVVGKANDLHYRRFVDRGKTNTEELMKLVRPCLLYPSKADFDRILQEVPAALVRCADAVCHLAGVRKDEAEGK